MPTSFQIEKKKASDTLIDLLENNIKFLNNTKGGVDIIVRYDKENPYNISDIATTADHNTMFLNRDVVKGPGTLRTDRSTDASVTKYSKENPYERKEVLDLEEKHSGDIEKLNIDTAPLRGDRSTDASVTRYSKESPYERKADYKNDMHLRWESTSARTLHVQMAEHSDVTNTLFVRPSLNNPDNQYGGDSNILAGSIIGYEDKIAKARDIYANEGLAGYLRYTESLDLAEKNQRILINIFKASEYSHSFGRDDASAQGKPGAIHAPTLGPPPYNNKYNAIIDRDYQGQFQSISPDSDEGAYSAYGERPSQAYILASARNRFIVGQLLGPAFDNPYAEGGDVWSRLTTMLLDIGAGRRNFNDFLKFVEDDYNQFAMQGFFSPNFTRPPQPGNTAADRASSYHTNKLDNLLNQNLLLPKIPANVPNISPGVDVFRASYLENRGKKKHAGNEGEADQKFPEGIIGGVLVHDLQEPYDPRDNPTENKLFDFKDDEKRLNPDRQDRGFIHNINVTGPGLEPAVINADQSKLGNLDHEAHDLGNNQYFPFLFETENKKDVKQYAFFQATLTQLQESYAPSWTSKTSIGRTEKIHTYIDTDRVLDLSFAIYADSGRQLQNVRERVTWLAQQTYGESEMQGNVVTRIKSGPLLRLSIGDIFKRVPGYLRNLSFNWDFLGPGGKWEMTAGLRMPQGVQVQCSFQVIHAWLPDRDFDFYSGLASAMPPSDDPDGHGRSGSELIPMKGELSKARSAGLQDSYISRLYAMNQKDHTEGAANPWAAKK